MTTTFPRIRGTKTTNRLRAVSTPSSADLFPIVYDELRSIASNYLRRQPVGHTLQPTALVHEAYMRLAEDAEAGTWERAQFLGIAARVMRHVLVDHTRRRTAAKRGGGSRRIALEEIAETTTALTWKGVDILALGEALEKLEELDARRARIVDMRVFLGMSVVETADAIGISPKTVEKDWAGARAWLRLALDRGE